MKKFIDILGIVLPALIILLGVVRVFAKKTTGVNGLTMVSAILLLIVGVVRFLAFGDRPVANNDSKLVPLAVSKHSEAFNRSVEQVLQSYFSMTEAFSAKDTSRISKTSAALTSALDSFRIAELQVDTLIYQTAVQPFENAKAETKSIQADPSLDEKKGSLNILSNELFALLSTVRYDLAKLYWLECASAFGEDRAGNWLSKTEQSKNPYGQENCAEIRTTINFVSADSTQKK